MKVITYVETGAMASELREELELTDEQAVDLYYDLQNIKVEYDFKTRKLKLLS